MITVIFSNVFLLHNVRTIGLINHFEGRNQTLDCETIWTKMKGMKSLQKEKINDFSKQMSLSTDNNFMYTYNRRDSITKLFSYIAKHKFTASKHAFLRGRTRRSLGGWTIG
jgi:hypothetical protein